MPAPRNDEGEAIGEADAGDDDLGVAVMNASSTEEHDDEAQRADYKPHHDRNEIGHISPPGIPTARGLNGDALT